MNDLIKYLNESPTIFFILSKKGAWVLEYVTNNVQKTFGYSSDDYIENRIHITDSIHEDDLSHFQDQAYHLTHTDKDEVHYDPYRIVTHGKTKWIQHISKIIRNKEGEPIHVYGYLTDITQQKALFSQLQQTKSIIETIFDHSSHFIGLLTPKGKVLQVNQTALAFIDGKISDILGLNFWDCPWWSFSTQVQEELQRDIAESSQGTCLKKMKYHYDSHGTKRYIDFSLSPVCDRSGEVIYLIAEGHDVTASVLSTKELNEYVSIIDDNVLITKSDEEGVIIDCSQAFCDLNGYTKEELLGQQHNIFRHDDTADRFFDELWETIKQGEIWRGEHKNITKSNQTIWVENIITPNYDENRNIVGYTSIYKDVTDKKEIAELLITDYLTKIYNRRHFNAIFEQELKRSRRHNYNFVLMIMDIDFFKQYNDTYGHQEGDNALISVAQNLKNSLHRPEDYAFRLGGEEFGVITSDITLEGAKDLALKLQKNIAQLCIEHKASMVNKCLTLSIGIKVVEPTENLNLEEIYKLADAALYGAKAKGRNTISF